MPKFTFYLETDARSTPEFVIDDLPDSLAAMDYARRLLEERPRYGKVEITQGALPVGALSREPSGFERPGPQPRSPSDSGGGGPAGSGPSGAHRPGR